MTWSSAANIALGLTTALVALLIAFLGWTHRSQHRALLPLAAVLATSAAWIAAEMARHLTVDPVLWMFWLISANAASLILPPLWLWFILPYAGLPHWVTRRLFGLLLIEPAVLAVLSLGTPLNNLFWQVSQPPDDPVFGPLAWVHRIYGLGLILVTTALLAHHLLSAEDKQTQPVPARATLLSATGLPLAGAILAPLLSVALLQPLAFVFAGLLAARSLFRITPVNGPAEWPLFDRLSDGLILVDDTQHIVALNTAASVALNEPSQELLGRPLSNVPGLASLVTGNPAQTTTLYSSITHRTYRLGLVSMGMEELPGVSLAIILRDVTLARPAAETYSQPQTMAETNRILKREILATMSHELRTPLNAIVGYTCLLGQGTYGPLNERQLERLDRINHSSQQLLHVVNNFLDLAMLESAPLPLEIEQVDVARLLDNCRLATQPLLAAKDLSLCVELAAGIPPALADGRRLRQALDHLLDNAIKFTPSGSVTLRAAHLPPGAPDLPPGAPDLPPDLPQPEAGWVAIAIADTGVGIDPQARPLIFDGFVQADSSTTRPYGGMGLGLAIARRLIEQMQGTIWVESVLGTGSTFTILLPAAPCPAPDDPIPTDSPAETAPANRIDHVASVPYLAG